MDSRMAIRVILLLTLFTGLCGAYLKGNVALNARVVQSSLYHREGAAEHAVDGNRDADYGKGSCTHTKVELNPWLRVDLGNVYSISKVALTNRGDCCKERLKGAQIRIGSNLKNNGNNNELVATVLTVFEGTKTFEFEPVSGRFVNIVLPGNDEILTLCEVEVFAEKDNPLYVCVPRNLALGGNAVQSTTYSSITAAHNAVDGNRQGIYSRGLCSLTSWEKDPWWRVDLGDVYRVTRVSITNRGDCCENRIHGIQIRIGNSLDNNGNNNELAATVGAIPLGDTKSFAFKPVKGRYVNLFLPGRSEYLTLCEVEVYSEKIQHFDQAWFQNQITEGASEIWNLALNARVVQSSLYQQEGAAEHAVDGNRDTDYGKGSCTHTKVELNPWLRVDLGNVYIISKVALTNRGDCCKERLKGAQIRIGSNLENNGNNNELVATVHTVFEGTKTFEFEPVSGQFVNIVLPGNDEILTLCEVEVFAEKDKPLYICVPRNLALGGKAVQSTTYSSITAAHNAVDGNRQAIYTLGSCSLTSWEKDPWWRVDLGDVYRVTRVNITNRVDCCEKRIHGIQIRIGNSLDNNGNNNELAATVGAIPLGDTKSFAFKPIKGRYVNIFLPGRSEYLTLCEVEVYSE